MSAPKLLLISEWGEDLDFWSEVASEKRMDLCNTVSPAKIRATAASFPGSFVVWSLDHPDLSKPRLDQLTQAIGTALFEEIPPARIFAMASNRVNGLGLAPAIASRLQHFVLRAYEGPARPVLTRLMEAGWVQYPTGAKRYFGEQVKSHKIVLRASGQRRAAVSAIQSFYLKQGLGPRLAPKIATAVDELLANAIFNAPHTLQGVPIRRVLSRSAEFSFGKRDLVAIEALAGDGYAAVSVTDSYGTFNHEALVRSAFKGFRSKEYRPPIADPAAGLGLHEIYSSGMSLLVVCKPGLRTDATVFFPLTSSSKAFKESFQFFSFLGGVALKRVVPKLESEE